MISPTAAAVCAELVPWLPVPLPGVLTMNKQQVAHVKTAGGQNVIRLHRRVDDGDGCCRGAYRKRKGEIGQRKVVVAVDRSDAVVYRGGSSGDDGGVLYAVAKAGQDAVHVVGLTGAAVRVDVAGNIASAGLVAGDLGGAVPVANCRPPEGKPAPAMLMSLVINSMAARMFCWVSARWVTVKVAFIPTRKARVMARMRIRPMTEAISNSRRLKPCCDFAMRIFIVFSRAQW